MKRFAFLCLAVSLGCATFFLGATPASATPSPQALRMSCSSDDMRRHVCTVDTAGGVVLIHQKSDAKCIQGRSWGFDNRSIWVDHGCRAEFEVGGQLVHEQHVDRDRDHDRGYDRHSGGEFQGWGQAYMVYCSSDDMQRAWCPADSRLGVKMVRQRSEAPCIEGQTWGYGKRGIWTDRGCRADFRVTGNWQADAAALVYCSSDYMQRNVCNMDTLDGVFIVRQRSEADCVFNRTWGYFRDGIWVDRGCRADFEVIDRRRREWREWSRDWNDDDRRGWNRDHGRDWHRDRDRDDYRDYDRPPLQ